MVITLKKSIINFCLLSLLLLNFSYVNGQEPDTDRRRSFLIPQYGIVQFAGSIGLISGGIGYKYGRNKLETDFLFGYLPEKTGGAELYTAAIKANWLPYQVPLSNVFELTPFTTGLMVSYTFGNEYFLWQPDYYPKGYYTFSTAAHLYYQFGSRINMYFPGKIIPEASFYYELNSSAEAIISLIQNRRALSPVDIFHLSLGVRIGF